MTSELQKSEDGSLILKIAIPRERVGKVYQTALAKIAQGVEIPGFRKGKAPENLVREKVDKNKVYEEVIRELIPQVYLEAVKEQGLSPIVNPKVSLASVKEGEDWQIEAATCEAPKAVLGDYKEKVRKMKGGPKIWVPGQGEGKEKSEGKEREERLQKVLEVLLTNIKLEIPPILLEDEINRRLPALRTEILNTLKLELILSRIAEEEKITVSPAEIETMIEKAQNKEKEGLKNQKYLLAHLLRRQKTLDFLLNL